VQRLAVRLAASRASKSTSADKTKKGPNPPHDGIHLVTYLLKGGGVRRRELGLRAGEQQRQAYYPRASELIIDNFAHSSRAAAIICVASATTLQDCTSASTSIRNLVSSAFRTTPSALCLLHPLQYSVHDPRDCPSSHPQLHVRPSSVEKHLLSDSFYRPLGISAQVPHNTTLPHGA